MQSIDPYDHKTIFKAFRATASFSKHLLTIYSMAIGLKAKRILDIGIGTTTRALRMAALETDGVVYSCDENPDYAKYLEDQDEHWKFRLCTSDEFFRQCIRGPIDFAVHDGSHECELVKNDLRLTMPMMRTFGLIVVHDVHWRQKRWDVSSAIVQATQGWSISMTSLPYCSGLAVIRIEEGKFPPGNICHSKRQGDTLPFACPMEFV